MSSKKVLKRAFQILCIVSIATIICIYQRSSILKAAEQTFHQGLILLHVPTATVSTQGPLPQNNLPSAIPSPRPVLQNSTSGAVFAPRLQMQNNPSADIPDLSSNLKSTAPAAISIPGTVLQSSPSPAVPGPSRSLHQSHPAQPRRRSECPHLQHPKHVQESFQFQPVGTENFTVVYSAFYDERDRVVRVIGLSLRQQQFRHWCHLWYDMGEGNTSQVLAVTEAKIYKLPEHHGHKYAPVFIHCPLNGKRQPYAVTVTSYDCHHDVSPPENVLAVVEPGRELTEKFTVCLQPINHGYDDVREVVEFIEMNRLLGADKFVVYVHQAGPRVQRVLDWYQQLHNYGQMAALNDCLYRHRGSSRYLVVADWDEILVPRNHSTWADLLDHVHHLNHRAFVEYRFECIFFRKDYPRSTDDFPGKELAARYQSSVLLVVTRDDTSWRKKRSKYIMDPRYVFVAGIHWVWTVREATRIVNTVTLPFAAGLNHHYRSSYIADKWRKKVPVKDTTMFRFKDELLKRLTETWKHFPQYLPES